MTGGKKVAKIFLVFPGGEVGWGALFLSVFRGFPVTSDLPTPSQLLGCGSFNSWYPGQYSLMERSLSWYDSPARFLGVAAPTGSGKSIIAMLLSRLSGARTCILTATKGLQDQYLRDCGAVGAVQVKGQNNFPCLLVPGLQADDGPCHDGMPCSLREQCPYRVQLSAAQRSDLVITNYSYWMAQHAYSSGLGEFDLLILDEAHQSFSSIEGFMTLHISRPDIQPSGLYFPDSPDQWSTWKTWAAACLPTVKSRVSQLESEIKEMRSSGRMVPGATSRAYRNAKALSGKLERLSQVTEDWVIQRTQHGYRFVPKWVANHSKNLFLDVPKVVLMSAILSKRSCAYIGIPDDDNLSWIEVPSYFPPENTQIWHVPTARINHRTDDYGATIWCSRVDQIIQRRLDRKGIVFTVSYDRARMLLSRSRFKDIMLTHSTGDVVAVIEKFKRMDAPAVLLSPSVTTGYDFPANRYNIKYLIAGKVPYPDTMDPVTKARHEEDKEWSSFLAMETLVQECGRASRGPEDRVECLILDDSWLWFYKLYKHFSPAWFRARVRGSLPCVPDPLV